MKGILLTQDTFDVIIKNGTLQTGDTNEQNAQIIILAEQGEFKEHPLLGVGLTKFLKSVGREREIVRAIRIQLALDGIKNPEISFNEGKLQIQLCDK